MIKEIQFICIVARNWHNLLVSKESSFYDVLLGVVVHVEAIYATQMFLWSF